MKTKFQLINEIGNAVFNANNWLSLFELRIPEEGIGRRSYHLSKEQVAENLQKTQARLCNMVQEVEDYIESTAESASKKTTIYVTILNVGQEYYSTADFVAFVTEPQVNIIMKSYICASDDVEMTEEIAFDMVVDNLSGAFPTDQFEYQLI